MPLPTPTHFPWSPSPAARSRHAQSLGWNLLDQPAQLRISTIDSFCRDLALQQPLLSGLGDGLNIYEQPEELYRRAARQTLEEIDGADPALRAAIEALLLGATTTGRRWKTCSSKCSPTATAGCKALSSSASRIGRRCASGSSAPSRTPSRNRSPHSASSSTRFPDPAMKLSNWRDLPASKAQVRSSSELAELADFPSRRLP